MSLGNRDGEVEHGYRKGEEPERTPRVDPRLDRHAQEFYAAFPLATDLAWSIVRSGWALTFFQSLEDFSRQAPSIRNDAGSGRCWILRARPPREIADSFDLQVEVLFLVTDFNDLQARTVELVRKVVDADSRVSRDVSFMVIGDEGADDKIGQVPHSDGVIPLSWGWVRSASGGGQGPKPLRSRLERFMYARDLFDVQIPVVGKRFFGRQQSLQFLKRQTLLDQPVGLFGLRKIGKTSLIKAFVDESTKWTEGDPIILATHVDLQALPLGRRDWAYLLWDIGRGAAQAWGRHPAGGGLPFNPQLIGVASAPSSSEVSTGFDQDLKWLLEAAWRRGGAAHLVIVFDEIERLVPPNKSERGVDGGIELLRYLRGLNQQGIHVSFVLAGANPYFAERSSMDGQENPLLNFVVKHYLAPLGDDEVRFMIQRIGAAMGIRFHYEAAGAVVTHGGGHPFLTRQLCSVTVKRLRSSRPLVVERSDVESALGDYSASQFHTFAQMMESLSEYPDELFLLRQLAIGDHKFVAEWAASDPVGLEHLRGYGLIEWCPSGWDFTIPLLREYVLKVTP